AGQFDGKKFTPAPGASSGYSVRYSSAAVKVEDDAARVQGGEVLDGPGKETQAGGIIPLPDGSRGTRIRVTLGPQSEKPIIPADAAYLSAKKAQDVYEIIARGSSSSKLLAFSGRPAILIPEVRLQGKQQLIVSFQTPIHVTQGVNWLTCPMPAASWT